MKKKLLMLSVFLLVSLCIVLTGPFLGNGFVAAAADEQTEVFSEKLTEGTYYYTVLQGEATITDAEVEGDITIPEELGGYPVTEIGVGAFSYQRKITSVIIPGCIKTVGAESFACCTGLETLVIEEGVEKIGAFAFLCEEYYGDGNFYYGSSLKNLTLSDSITELGRGAFERTLLEGTITLPKNLKVYRNPFSFSKVDAIVIPEGLEFSEDIVFVGNSYNSNSGYKPIDIIIDENNDSYIKDDKGFIYAEDNKILVFSTNADIKEFIVPETVEVISDYCFALNKENLESIVLPGNLQKIGDYAFSGCSLIKDIKLPDKVSYIGEYAFEECENLEKIKLPEGIKEINYATFLRCYKLAEVNLPSTLTKIDSLAFSYTALSGELIVPENVIEVGSYAFGNGITHLKFLSNNLTLQNKAFSDCKNLVEVEFAPGDLYIGDGAFPTAKSFTKVTLPEGNVTLGNSVFYNTYINTLEVNSSNVTIENITTNPDIYEYYSNFTEEGTIIFGKNVSEINVNLFAIRFIEKIILDSENPYFTITDHALYNKDMTELIRFFYLKKDGVLDYFAVPDTVKIIGPQAFRRARVNLIKLNQGLETISEYAFFQHDYFNVITIPETVTEIKKSAFGKCKALYSVCFPKGEEEWNKITVGSGNDYFENAKKYFYHEHILSDYVYDNNSVYGEKDGTKTAYCVNGCGLKHRPDAEGSINVLTKPPKLTYISRSNRISVYWGSYKPNHVTGYRVYLYDKDTGKYTKIATTSKTVIFHENLTPGTEYNYLVRAYKKLDDGTVVWSPYSTDDILFTGTLPEKVSSITAKQSASAIKLTWKEVSGASGYRVYKYVKATGKYTKLGTVQKPTATIKNLKAGTTYAYLIRAYKQLSDGTILWADYSEKDIFFTGTLPEKVSAITVAQSASAIRLNWREVPGASGYRVYKYVEATGKYTKLGTVKNPSATIKNLKAGTTYAYLVRAYKQLSDGTVLWADYSKYDVFYTSTKSQAPTLKGTSGTKKFTLSWNKVVGAENYEVWYSTSENGTYKKLATVTGTTYSKSCSSGKTYYFKVRAMKNVNGQTIKGEASIAKGIKIK